MIIKELYLKNFGKFTDTRVELSEKISVIYGENEYGKSTLYAFIKAMLFGLERGRGRAAGKSDFSRYEPWENPGYYAGVMRFSCGERNFRLERAFDKPSREAVLVCEDDGEELSVKDGDLDMLLGGMTLTSFENAAAIGPLAAKPGQELAAELKNYAANYYETGSGEVDFYGAMEALKERKKSVEQKLKAEKEAQENQIETLRIQSEVIRADMERLDRELREIEANRKNSEKQLEQLQRKQLALEKMEESETGIQEEAELDKGGRRGSLNKESHKVLSGVLLIVLGILGSIGIWSMKLPGILFIVPAAGIGIGLFLLVRSADGFRKQNRVSEKTDDNSGKQKPEVKKRQEQLSDEAAHLQEQLKQFQWAKERNRADAKEKQVQLHNLQEQAEESALPGDTWRKLRHSREALELAMEKLQEAAAHMTQEFGERLNRETSAILAQITNGKYTRVFVDEQLQMSVYCEGRRVSVERLSRGTIEQVYFSLRMAAMDLLYEENIPVIFDDAFLCYDEKRLKSVLKWLSEQPRQVIIFSCQRREKEIIKQF